MKKTILCILIMSLLGTFAITHVIAEPEITDITGGVGVAAIVTNASGCDWEISVFELYPDDFPNDYIISKGTIQGNDAVTIHSTVPPVFFQLFCFGVVKILVTLSQGSVPVTWERLNGFMLGPFILFVHEIS
jgi:hypothetical protein